MSAQSEEQELNSGSSASTWGARIATAWRRAWSTLQHLFGCLPIAGKLLAMLMLLIGITVLIATFAVRGAIEYVVERELVDLSDESALVRTQIQTALSQAESLVRTKINFFKAPEKSRWESEDISAEQFEDARKNLAPIVTGGVFFDSLDVFREALKDPSAKSSNRPAIRRELLTKYLRGSSSDEAILSPSQNDSPTLRTEWSGLYWVDQHPKQSYDAQTQRAHMQILVVITHAKQKAPEQKEESGDNNDSQSLGKDEFWVFEVDMSSPLEACLKERWVRTFPFLLNASESRELTYSPFGNPKSVSVRTRNDAGELEVVPSAISFTASRVMRASIDAYNEAIMAEGRSELVDTRERGHQYPEVSVLTPKKSWVTRWLIAPWSLLVRRSDDPARFVRLNDLLHCDNDRIAFDDVRLSNADLTPQQAEKAIKYIVPSLSSRFGSPDPMRHVRTTAGQNCKINLRAGSEASLNGFKQEIQQKFREMLGDERFELNWKDSTLNHLVLNVSAVQPPGRNLSSDPVFYLVRSVALDEIQTQAEYGLAFLNRAAIYAALFAICITSLVAFTLTRPLRVMIRTAQQISKLLATPEHGMASELNDWLNRLPTGRRDENGLLASELKKAFEGFVHKNQEVDEQNSKLKFHIERNRELRDKEQIAYEERRIAEQANEAKTRFLSMISHDMRTPLQRIFTTVETILEDEIPQELVRRLKQIHLNANKVTYLIDDLLDFERFRTGTVEINPREFEISELLDQMYDHFESAAHERGNDLQFENRCTWKLYTDRFKVERILTNLLSNACKFTASGTIRLTCMAESGDRVRFEVRDTGRGMTTEQQAKVFVPFERATQTEGNRDGTGLGLYICKCLAQALGGDITFTSRFNEGTEFVLVLPMRVEQAEVKVRGAPSDATETQQPKSAFSTGSSSSRPPFVMIVEDEVDCRRDLHDYLENSGFDVETAIDGFDALDKIQRRCPDVFLIDLTMSNMDGRTLIENLRMKDDTKNIPILVLTNLLLSSQQRAELDPMIQGFIRKGETELSKIRDQLIQMIDSTPSRPFVKAQQA